MPKKYIFGIDWGTRNSSTMIAIIDSKGRLVCFEELQGYTYKQQINQVKKLVVKYKPSELYTDTTGIGSIVTQYLKDELRGYEVNLHDEV